MTGTNRTSKTDLSPCPFCASTDLKVQDGVRDFEKVWLVQCVNCEVTGPVSEMGKEAARRLWNERSAVETSACRYEAAIGAVCNKCGRIHDFGQARCAECQTPRLCGVERECLRNRYVRPAVEPTAKHDDKDIRMFLGWLAVELPELHNIETPRLGAAWEKWRALMDDLPLETEAFTPSQIGQIVADNCEPCDERCEHSPEKATEPLPTCQHDLLQPNTTIAVDPADPFHAWCTVCKHDFRTRAPLNDGGERCANWPCQLINGHAGPCASSPENGDGKQNG